ncbi:MAG: hypothetical protein ACXAEU_06705 [Candidatus Hodarchaeales archaeon]
MLVFSLEGITFNLADMLQVDHDYLEACYRKIVVSYPLKWVVFSRIDKQEENYFANN